MAYEKTRQLRASLDALGIRYTRGYSLGSDEWKKPTDERTDLDRVTCVWPRSADAAHSVTFEEDEWGDMWVADEVTPAQALALALAGAVDWGE